MMRQQPLRLCAGTGTLLLLAGCGMNLTHRRSDELGSRFEQQLWPELADRQAALQPVPNGVRLVVADDALFPAGSATLTEHGRFVLASVIESLLAPALLHIEVTEAPGTPTPLQQARVQTVTEFMQDFLLGPALQPGAMQSQTVAAAVPGMTPAGLAVTVTLRPRQG